MDGLRTADVGLTLRPFEIAGADLLKDGPEEDHRRPPTPGASSPQIITTTTTTSTSAPPDHEVCYAGGRLVWTAGGVVRQTLRAQGGDIVDAVWANFHDDDGDNTTNNNSSSSSSSSAHHNNNKRLLCVLTREDLTSYKGAEALSIATPRPSSKLWPMSLGVLLQGEDTNAAAPSSSPSSTPHLWFLGGALSELTEVEVPTESASASVRFASNDALLPYLVLYNRLARCHEVFRYAYAREAHFPQSVPTLRLERLEMSWSSYQFPGEGSWVEMVRDESGEALLVMLQTETNQMVAFSLPRAARGAEARGAMTPPVVRETFSVPAISATKVTSSSSSSSSSSSASGLMPTGLVVLTPELEIFLYCGSWCVCRVHLGKGTHHRVRQLRSAGRGDKFLCELLPEASGPRQPQVVEATIRLDPIFELTRSAMRALDSALPKELYHEVYGAFLARGMGKVARSGGEEWEAFERAFADLVETREGGGDGVGPGAGPGGAARTDWDDLLASNFHRRMVGEAGGSVFAHEGSPGGSERASPPPLRARKLSQTQLLLILESLHGLYEDSRLDLTRWADLSPLLDLLDDLAHLIGSEADQYRRRYQADRGAQGERSWVLQDRPPTGAHPNAHHSPADMYRALEAILDCGDHAPWVPRQLVEAEAEAEHLSWSRKVLKLFLSLRDFSFSSASPAEPSAKEARSGPKATACDPTVVLDALVADDWSLGDLQRLPFGLALPIQETIVHCRDNPELGWPGSVYMILNRQDLAANCSSVGDSLLSLPHSLGLWARAKDDEDEDEGTAEFTVKNSSVSVRPTAKTSVASAADVASSAGGAANDGMCGIDKDSAKLRFSQDLRLKEVRKILSSSCARPVQLPKGMDLSHPETNNVQQTKLHEMAMKTMALPVGRGAFSLSTLTPLPTEPFSIPDLTLSGTLPHQNNAHISLDLTNLKSQNMLDWPQFHNGVAAGLQLSKGQAQLTRTWVVYNKTAEPSNDHAGFLMALGLQGHLGCLSVTDIYRYLSQEDDMTTIGVLLGVSAANIGKMDTTISKMLFLHIPARHPAHYPELELSSLIQAAALVGVGLLYLGSSHRIMTEVLLEEIVRKPSTDNWRDQEGYALAAGIGLGLVNLGRGPSTTGLADMDLEDRLCYFMNGGSMHKYSNRMRGIKAEVGSGSGHPVGSSAQVMEENFINLNVTSPAAAYALGLMYLQTNDRTMASRFSNPESNFALDFVRPDFILLRVLFRSLIMWKEVKAAPDWVEGQIPRFLRQAVREDGSVQVPGEYESDFYDVDLHTIAQCHLYALTGACVALGVRYAGSSNEKAKRVLSAHILKLLKFKAKSPDIAMVHTSPNCNRANKPTLEQCVCVIALALALVMAGSGDLETFKLLRGLHSRDNTKSGRMSYATSMAVSMAVGFLFLGGGQLSFSTSKKAVASILISLFPHFPASTTDNRTHLQALRHLYVLGAENRCMEAIDVESWETVRCPLEIEVEDGQESYAYSCLTPTIIPEREKIKSIKVKGPRFWERQVEISSSAEIGEASEYSKEVAIIIPKALWDQKRIYVKRKLGLLPYDTEVDSESVLCRTFHSSSDILQLIQNFTSDPFLLGFAETFCEAPDPGKRAGEGDGEGGSAGDGHGGAAEDGDFVKFCQNSLYECLAEDKVSVLKTYLSVYLAVEQHLQRRKEMAGIGGSGGIGLGARSRSAEVLSLWNVRLAHTYCTKLGMMLNGRTKKPTIHRGFVRACWNKIIAVESSR